MKGLRRGSIVWVDLSNSVGQEQNKVRPAVVVSNDGANRTVERLGRGVVTVVPVSTWRKRALAFHVSLPEEESGLQLSVAQAEQVRSVDLSRISLTPHRLGKETLRRLDDALRLHLSL